MKSLFRSLCISLLLSVFVTGSTEAQAIHFDSPLGLAVIYAGDDTTVYFPFYVGDSVPDLALHHFKLRSISPDPGVKLLTPSSGSFTGRDSLGVHIHTTTSALGWQYNLHFRIDVDQYSDSLDLGMQALPFEPLHVDTAYHPQVKIGSVNRYNLKFAWNQSWPVRLLSIQSDLPIDTTYHFPFTIADPYVDYSVPLVFRAPSTPQTLKANVTITAIYGNHLSTDVYPIEFDCVHFFNDCINGQFIQIDNLFSWKLSGEATLKFQNAQPRSIRIDSANIVTNSLGVFTFDHSYFPLQMSALDSGFFKLRYSIPSDTRTSDLRGIVTFYLSGLDTDGIACPNNSFYFVARLQKDFVDSGIVKLYPFDSSDISIVSSDGHGYQEVHLLNNSTSAIKIRNLRIASGDSGDFSLIRWELPQDSIIPPDSSFPIFLEFLPFRGKFRPFSHLLVQLADSTVLTPIALHGFREPIWISVQEPVAELPLQMFPNPVRDDLTINIGAPNQANVVVSDALGRIVYQSKMQASTFTIPMHGIPNGSYTCVVSGIDNLHRVFQRARHIIISH